SPSENPSSFQELVHLGQNISAYMEDQEAHNRDCIAEHVRHMAGIKDLIGKVRERNFPEILKFLQEEIAVEGESNARMEKAFEAVGAEEGVLWRTKRSAN